MRLWSEYIDNNWLIVHKDGGGDSGQRSGMYFIGRKLTLNQISPENQKIIGLEERKQFEKALDAIEVEPGIYIRHPKSTEAWHSDPKEFSRDQQTPLVIAMGFYDMHDRLWRLFKKHILRFGKYQNKDWMGPTHFGQYIRAFRIWIWWPVLIFTDIVMVIAVLVRVIISKFDKDDVGDDLNMILELLQARFYLPTPFSWMARMIYVAFRPSNYGNTKLACAHPIQGTLAWYFREEAGAPPMDELYEPIIKKFFLEET